MITINGIQQKRTPFDLRKYVIDLKEDVRKDKSELEKGILKEDLYKQFLEEIVPLSLFSLLYYSDEYLIQPIIGNQGYDALVLDESGRVVDKIEITAPQNGYKESIDAKSVVEKGYSEIYGGDRPTFDIDALFPFIIKTCEKKSKKDYWDCNLVVAIEPIQFSNCQQQFDEKIKILLTEMKQIRFKAKRVFLLVMPDKLLELTQ